jgi:TolB-like protein
MAAGGIATPSVAVLRFDNPSGDPEQEYAFSVRPVTHGLHKR